MAVAESKQFCCAFASGTVMRLSWYSLMKAFSVSCPIKVRLEPETKTPNPGDDTNNTSSVTMAAPLTLSDLGPELEAPVF